MTRYVFPLVAATFFILLTVFWFYEKGTPRDAMVASPERQAACEQFLTVATFTDGEAAQEFMEACLRGEPVLPEDNPDGLSGEEADSDRPAVGPGCAVGGCSSQICGEAGEVEDIATTCEWREEYACFAASRCERQINGQCGWTETDAFNQCIQESGSAAPAFIY